MIALKINPAQTLLKFDSLLPVYNWYYPFDADEDELPDPEAPLQHAGRVRRRALYLHIPFCETICSFCPFYKAGYRHAEQVERYVQALLAELAWKARFPAVREVPVHAIAVGGGSPSVMTADQVLRLGDALHRHFDLSHLREFTFELEVKSVTPDKVRAMRTIGVNRVSLGVQTFSPVYRDLFALSATLEQVRQAVELVKAAFPFTNADMIYAMAGQSLDEVLEDAEGALSLGTTTVDFYPLNNAAAQLRLHRAFREASLRPLSAAVKVSYRMFLNEYLRGRGWLPVNGYGYARAPAHLAGRPVVWRQPVFLYHDIVYGYADEEVLGFGAGALSQLVGCNLHNPPNRDLYTDALLHTGRLPLQAFGNVDCPEKGIVYFPYRGVLEKGRVEWERVPEYTRQALARACQEGLAEERGDAYVLTPAGWLFYVNLIYYLTPERGRAWLSRRIALRWEEGREQDPVSIYPLTQAQLDPS